MGEPFGKTLIWIIVGETKWKTIVGPLCWGFRFLLRMDENHNTQETVVETSVGELNQWCRMLSIYGCLQLLGVKRVLPLNLDRQAALCFSRTLHPRIGSRSCWTIHWAAKGVLNPPIVGFGPWKEGANVLPTKTKTEAMFGGSPKQSHAQVVRTFRGRCFSHHNPWLEEPQQKIDVLPGLWKTNGTPKKQQQKIKKGEVILGKNPVV